MTHLCRRTEAAARQHDFARGRSPHPPIVERRRSRVRLVIAPAETWPGDPGSSRRPSWGVREAKSRAYLLFLVQERGLRPASFNVYAGALRFLYEVTLDRPGETTRMPRMRVPMHMPVRISNRRLVSMDESGVTFRTKDGRSVTVAGPEMLARFVQHVLPSRFVKIRHYGLHSARHATPRLELARRRLEPSVTPPRAGDDTPDPPDTAERILQLTGIDVRLCPACDQLTLARTPLPDVRCRAPPVAA
jgi:hypothetical protein